MKHEFTCHVCGKHKVKENKDGFGSTGYGIDKDGNKVCFDCCGKQDAEHLENIEMGGRTYLYLVNEDGRYYVTNWPGTLKIAVRPPRKGRHNFAGSRYDVWFKFRGNQFHGVQYGEMTQVCHIRRIN